MAWFLTGLARLKLYLFVVVGCNNPSDTWEISMAVKISKKNFTSVICVRAWSTTYLPYTLKGFHDRFTSAVFEPGKSSHARMQLPTRIAKKTMYLHCYRRLFEETFYCLQKGDERKCFRFANRSVASIDLSGDLFQNTMEPRSFELIVFRIIG